MRRRKQIKSLRESILTIFPLAALLGLALGCNPKPSDPVGDPVQPEISEEAAALAAAAEAGEAPPTTTPAE